MPKYPEITVQLTGEDGNVFSVLGRVVRAMKEYDVPQDEIDAFWEEASSGDYDKALQTCMAWVDAQ